MTDCTDLVDDLHAQARNHVRLTTMADAWPVAEMHIELALFSERQARVADDLCEEE